MADIEITVDGGTSKRLLTAGKYCDKNILITTTGGGGGTEPEPPQDGKTRLYIRIPANAKEGLPPLRNQVPLYIQQNVKNGVTIDWGDGTAPETLPGTGEVNTTHTYQQEGDYVISLEPASDCILSFGRATIATYNIMGFATGPVAYYTLLKKVHFGNNITSTGYCAFQHCCSLTDAVFSNSITKISQRSFQSCQSLLSIEIPSNVTTIETYAFSACYFIKEFHFYSATPPTLVNSSAFNKIPTDCIFYVPKGSAE